MSTPEPPAVPTRSISSARTARSRETKSGRLTLTESIAQQIDWNPTCLPGTEKAAIVRQILELDDVVSDDDYWLRIDALAASAASAVPASDARELAEALAEGRGTDGLEVIYGGAYTDPAAKAALLEATAGVLCGMSKADW